MNLGRVQELHDRYAAAHQATTEAATALAFASRCHADAAEAERQLGLELRREVGL